MDNVLQGIRSRIFSKTEHHFADERNEIHKEPQKTSSRKAAGRSGRWPSNIGRKSSLRLFSSTATSPGMDSSDGSSSMSSDLEAVIAAAAVTVATDHDNNHDYRLPGIGEESSDDEAEDAHRHHSEQPDHRFSRGSSKDQKSTPLGPSAEPGDDGRSVTPTKSTGSSPYRDHDQTHKEMSPYSPMISNAGISPDPTGEKVNREAKAAAWSEAETAKIENRFNAEKAEILAWVNDRKVKANVRMNRIEKKLEDKRAKANEKMQNEIDRIRKKAEERMAKAEAIREAKKAKIAAAADHIRSTGRMPKKSCFL